MKHYKEPYDSDGVRLWIEWNLESYKDFGFGLWAVLLKGQNDENDTFIGDCGITMQRIGRWIRPEIGCHINKKYHRMGLASEGGTLLPRLYFRKHAVQHCLFLHDGR